MEPRIDPVTPRYGITGVSGERRQQNGSKQAFEEALDKQRKDGKDGKEGKDGKSDPSPEGQPTQDIVTLSHQSPAPSTLPLQGEGAPDRKEDGDDRPHVDVVV